MLKLNMGCGLNTLAGFVNVDKEFAAAGHRPLANGERHELVQHDLEQFPWPWASDSVDEVLFNHSLEHLGADPKVFLQLMQELYRVCARDALVRINVPHPRHDNFIGDPTHVRVVTPQVLSLFSRANCERWARERAANTPLALYLGVDFELLERRLVLEDRYREAFDAGEITAVELDRALAERNNVAREIRMMLRVVK